MLVFCKNKLLVKHETFDFDEEYITAHEGLRILRLSSELPDNWKTLTQWADAESESLREGEELIGLRELWGIAGSQVFARAGGALMFAEWFRNFRMCPCCGGDLLTNSHDFGRKCSGCGKVYYVPQSPAVIVAVEREGNLLLAHNSAWQNDRYSVIAGFVEPGECLEDAVRREVHEEVSVEVSNIQYFGSQVWPFPNSLMLGFTAQYSSGEVTPDGTEIARAGWYTADEIRDMNIPDGASIARRLINHFLDTH
ncbi:MAG: NAD(+) diphosphatase [Synergistaceae bacterium]|nr:NAD(+) diphosphatase [Synergistaceae bacterium]